MNATILNKDLIKVIEQLDSAFHKRKSIQIAGLTEGLTTKWHTYNFLDIENKSIATLKKFVKKEVAKDNNYNIVRPYCAGWLVPIYFAGRTMIVDRKGNVVSKSKSLNKSENVIANLN